MLTRLEWGTWQEPAQEQITVPASESSVWIERLTAEQRLCGWSAEPGFVSLDFGSGGWRWMGTAEFTSIDGSEPNRTVWFYGPVGNLEPVDYTRPMIIITRINDDYYVESLYSVHATRLFWLLMEPLELQLHFLAGFRPYLQVEQESRDAEFVRLTALEPVVSTEEQEEPQIFTTS